VAWKSQVAKLAQMPVPGEQLIILGSIRIYPQQYKVNKHQHPS
jgi:exodeoxyribonuclease VII large subunit